MMCADLNFKIGTMEWRTSIYTAKEKPRHIVGIFKNTRICHEYVGNWLILHKKLAKSTEVVLK